MNPPAGPTGRRKHRGSLVDDPDAPSLPSEMDSPASRVGSRGLHVIVNGVTRVGKAEIEELCSLLGGLSSAVTSPLFTVFVRPSMVPAMEPLRHGRVRVLPARGTDRVPLLRYWWREVRLPRFTKTGREILLSPRGVGSLRWPCQQVVILDDLRPFSAALRRELGLFRRLFLVPFLDSAYRASIREADLTLVHGDAGAGALKEAGCEPRLLQVMPRGVDPVFYPVADPGDPAEIMPGSAGVRADESGAEGTVRILVGCPLSGGNGLETETRALALLVEKGIDAELLVTDETRRGGPARKLRRLAASLGVDERVRILERPDTERRSELYRGASVLLYLPRFRCFPRELLEATATGCPSVVSRELRCRSLVGDLPIRVDRESPEEVARGVRSALDPELVRRTLTVGPELARPYAWPAMAREYAWMFLALARGSLRGEEAD